MLKLICGCQNPLSNTEPITPTNSNKLMDPFIPSFSSVTGTEWISSRLKRNVSKAKKIANKQTAIKSMGRNIADVVQKKSTPLRKPKNKGGSPNGVNEPPILATRKIKNRPSYEQLKKDLKNSSYVQVGKKYNVSDNCIRKWLKTYKKYNK